MKLSWKLLLAMVAGVLLFAGCGDSSDSEVAHSTTTEEQDETITSENEGFEFNGLYWQVGPDEDTWDEAVAWVDGLGGNWRMPTRAELRGLSDAGIRWDNWGPFENMGASTVIWSGEVRDSSSSWCFDFNYNGSEVWKFHSTDEWMRAFAVRTEGQDETITSGNDGFEFDGWYWQVGPDRDMNWYEAKAWVESLGGNWRMPTCSDLNYLQNGCGISSDNWGPFENSGRWVWSGEVHDSLTANTWPFDNTNNFFAPRDYSNNLRAFAVRPR